MYDISPKDPRIASLSPSDISAYLQKKGWKAFPHPHGKLTIFSGPHDDDGKLIELFIPRKKDFIDTPLRMAEAVNMLAFIEERLPDEIIHSIGALDRDIIYTRGIESEEKTMTGKIINLKASPGSLDDDDNSDEEASEGDRVVVIFTEEKSTKFNVHVQLDPENYRNACNAHRDGKWVSVKGRLEKQKKSWVMFSPTDFHQVDE